MLVSFQNKTCIADFTRSTCEKVMNEGQPSRPHLVFMNSLGPSGLRESEGHPKLVNTCAYERCQHHCCPLNEIIKNDEGHPIAFFNEKLKGAQLNYSTYGKELMLLFVPYKCGNTTLLKRPTFLEQFTYVIKHKQRKSNIVVDALSRRIALLAILVTKLLGLRALRTCM
ncbi:hypothetical protein CR513_38066, partial [Mucuna pruriens]